MTLIFHFRLHPSRFQTCFVHLSIQVTVVACYSKKKERKKSMCVFLSDYFLPIKCSVDDLK